jgi:multiple sugar transport system ATP-binding protein
MAQVSLTNIVKRYGAHVVVPNLDLEIADGEFVVLVGPSGCGKTTTLQMIAGLESISAGTLRIGGRDVTHLPAKDRDIAMVFQSYALFPHMTVRDNVNFGLRIRRTPAQKMEHIVADVAERLQIAAYLDRLPRALSGGQRQRVALGRALAIDPHLLLLDEPMSNLDYKVRLELRHELRALQQRIGITAVYVTHDREEALTLADRIAVIDAGRVVQVGAPEEIFHRPTSAFVAGFMGADNAIDVGQRSDGALIAAPESGPELRLRAHFRSDAARMGPAGAPASDGDLVLSGTIVQAVYIGQGYRYRFRTPGGDVWVHAPDRMPEGTTASVIVPRKALLLFPPGPAHAAGAPSPAAWPGPSDVRGP